MVRLPDEILKVCMKYIHVIKAQTILEKHCGTIGITINELNCENLPKVILEIAKGREDFNSISDDQFYRLLKELVFLANSLNEPVKTHEKKMIFTANTDSNYSYEYNHDPILNSTVNK